MVKPVVVPDARVAGVSDLPSHEISPADPLRSAGEPCSFTSVSLPHAPNPEGLARMGAAAIRSCFLLESHFERDRVACVLRKSIAPLRTVPSLAQGRSSMRRHPSSGPISSRNEGSSASLISGGWVLCVWTVQAVGWQHRMKFISDAAAGMCVVKQGWRCAGSVLLCHTAGWFYTID